MKRLFLIALFTLTLSPWTAMAMDEGMSNERPEASWHQEVRTGPLQKEIDRLLPNEHLLLPKGVHEGPIHIRTPGVTIEGAPGAIISAGGKDSVIVISADNVTIKGLTITASGTSYTQGDSGIGLRSVNNARLIRNKLVDCLFGIDVYGGKNITIQGNDISSKNLELGLRGDAIRLWTVTDSEVSDNSWSHSRDVVAWYSKKILFTRNAGSDSRYSLHSMYSEHLRIQNNIFKRNKVGIFLMYGTDFIITNNLIERSLGATGMGIGLKESSNILAQNNTITYSAVGVLVDNSPYKMGSRNWFHGNKLSFNGKGVVLSNDLPGGEFKRNAFIGNLEDVNSENRNGSRSLWDRNYWDKYIGFDQNQDNVGDTSFIVRKYGDTLKGSDPKAAFFYGTPLFTLLEMIEEVTHIGEPIIVLNDQNPLLVKK